MRFSHASKSRLTSRDLGRFPGTTLFDRAARAVCAAGCLPRKELYEAWEVARRSRREFRGGRVIDFGAGHGLLAHVMLLLDDTSPGALAVDVNVPPSAGKIRDSLERAWPRLSGRIEFVTGTPDDVALHPGDVVVSCHACGAFADRVLESAAAHARGSPCCPAATMSKPATRAISPAGWTRRSRSTPCASSGCARSATACGRR